MFAINITPNHGPINYPLTEIWRTLCHSNRFVLSRHFPLVYMRILRPPAIDEACPTSLLCSPPIHCPLCCPLCCVIHKLQAASELSRSPSLVRTCLPKRSVVAKAPCGNNPMQQASNKQGCLGQWRPLPFLPLRRLTLF